ncbi:hypothetical protein SAMN05444422_109171 [Halobiforma haloterrestris]|uniref:DUF2238 domain-containing protein n=1 Tax=Natronobacterium haloterrestre TaxID=148448 RepID=A0A1I1JY12_NATHA|nr:hypothetical protein SAMN05444422_109171 [Halobiforma haloterrestris]
MNRLLHAGIVAALVAGIRRRDPSVIVNGALSLTFGSLPRYLERRYDVHFRPWQREWISTAALVHTLGMLGPYDRVWWWDHLAHTLSGVVFAGVVDVVYRSDVDGERHVSSRSRTAFVAGITFGLGFVWEVFEYIVHALGDRIGFDPLLVHYGRLDAVGDLVFDLVGAMIVLLFGRDRLSNLVDSERDES